MTATAADLDTPLKVGDYTFNSRLIVGTGKYETFPLMRDCPEASGTECITVAVRRVKLDGPAEENLLSFVDESKYKILPNTAGCFSAEDAIRTAHLSREELNTPVVKLQVLADPKTLLPDPVGTLMPCNKLVKEGFTVMV